MKRKAAKPASSVGRASSGHAQPVASNAIFQSLYLNARATVLVVARMTTAAVSPAAARAKYRRVDRHSFPRSLR